MAPARWRLRLLVASVALGVSICAISFSLWCALFGPRWGVLLGAAGFVVGWFAVATGFWRLGKALSSGAPNGLSAAIPALDALRGPIRILAGVLVCALFLSIIVFFCSNGFAGRTGYPVFQELPSYRLSSGGHYTEVSRLRYVLVGSSFFVGWHSGALLASLVSLHSFLYGRRAGLFDRKRDGA